MAERLGHHSRAPTPEDLAQLREQLGRPPRGVYAVAFRCRGGHPGVVETEPQLPDGTPFPTLYYLTCPRLTSAIGRLEASGVMTEWTARLDDDTGLREQYRRAHVDYVRRRNAISQVPRIAGVSAGGMPDRVKCLHALAAHALAVGPGINPFGDETVDQLVPHTHIDYDAWRRHTASQSAVPGEPEGADEGTEPR